MKTCFLICPIGDDGSPVRRRADDLLELVVQPALEVFQFDVVRADRIPRASVITNDIIQLVQESQLCIADISDRNPNVFYEIGRRHETGKPLIQLIDAGQEIPFDLSGIRTLEYSLGSPREVKAVIEKIRAFIKSFEDSGYAQPASGASLASIAGSIERMERQIAKLAVINAPSSGLAAPLLDPSGGLDLSALAANPFIASVMGPAMQIESMISAGRVDEAAAVLMRAKDRLSREKFQQLSSMLTMAGVESARVVTLEFIESSAKSGGLGEDELMLGLGSLVHYYGSQDREKEGVQNLGHIFPGLLEAYKDTPKIRAFIYNQMAKLYDGAGDLDSAFLYSKKATESWPDELAYQRNFEGIRRKHEAGAG